MNIRVNLLKSLADDDFNNYCTMTPVSTEQASKEFIDDYGIDDSDDAIMISIHEAYGYGIENIDWYNTEFDSEEYRYFLEELLKPANHYLIKIDTAMWNGSSGYKIVDELTDIFYRDYDTTVHLKGISKGGKTLEWVESSHDVPMGSSAIAIALTDKEYEKLSDQLEFDNFRSVDHFAENCLNKVIEVK